MDYKEMIKDLLKKANKEQLKRIYLFLSTFIGQ